jgi:hypothetical protein
MIYPNFASGMVFGIANRRPLHTAGQKVLSERHKIRRVKLKQHCGLAGDPRFGGESEHQTSLFACQVDPLQST